MPDDRVVMRSARNAYGVMLLLLLALSTYQFVTINTLTPPLIVLWVAAVGVFYGSKWYYGRD